MRRGLKRLEPATKGSNACVFASLSLHARSCYATFSCEDRTRYSQGQFYTHSAGQDCQVTIWRALQTPSESSWINELCPALPFTRSPALWTGVCQLPPTRRLANFRVARYLT